MEVYSVAPLVLAHTFCGHQSRCNSVAISPDGKTLASAACDGNIKLWPLDTLRVPPARPKIAAGVTIVKGEWGGGKIWADVTPKVQEAVAGDHNVWATPDWLKSDPTPGWRKHLNITYTKDGQKRTLWRDEDAMIKPEEFK